MKEKSVITIEAKEEIRKNITELKEVLKDDKEFAQELIDKIKSELDYDIIELMDYDMIGKIQIFKSYKNIILCFA